MSAADKAKLDGAATIVSAVTGTLPITVATGTSTPVIAIDAATTGALGAVQIGTNIDVTTGTISIKNASATDKGVIEIATLAEAATGTDATRALTPSTGVPKDAATMTGAALIPGGNNAARPTPTPVTGMLRYNNQGGTPATTIMEYYNGAAWTSVGTAGGGSVGAFASFDGTNLSIYSSANVSSITRLGPVGQYQMNYTNALASTSPGYAFVAGDGTPAVYGYGGPLSAPSNTNVTMGVLSSGIWADVPYVSMTVFSA
jgi:hypothetical protein